MERKVEVRKDNVIKSIDENLVSLYLLTGWTKVEKHINKPTTKGSSRKLVEEEE